MNERQHELFRELTTVLLQSYGDARVVLMGKGIQFKGKAKEMLELLDARVVNSYKIEKKFEQDNAHWFDMVLRSKKERMEILELQELIEKELNKCV